MMRSAWDTCGAGRRAPWRALAGLIGLALAACAGRTPAPAEPQPLKPPAAAPAVADAAAPAVADDAELDATLRRLGQQGPDAARLRDKLVARGPAITPRVLPYLSDPSWTLRWEVVNLFSLLRDERAIPDLLERVLGDDNPHVRWRSLTSLALNDARGGKCIPVFLEHLEDPQPDRRWNAAVGLAFFKDPRAVPRLHAALGSQDPFVRWEAVFSLSAVNDRESSALLEPVLLRDPDDGVRREVVMSLRAMCDAPALRLLEKALALPDRELRWRAALVAGLCRKAELVEPLKARLEREADPQVRKEIEGALAKLGSR